MAPRLSSSQRRRARARLASRQGVPESTLTDADLTAAIDTGLLTSTDYGGNSGGGGDYSGGYSSGGDSGGG